MNRILLDASEIQGIAGSLSNGKFEYIKIAKAQLIKLIKYLEEPCTEHEKQTGCYLAHRYMCKYCISEIKKELGI